MKSDFYNLLNKQAEALLLGEADLIAAMANFTALLYENISDVNWLGFYIYKNGQLVLGPFQGKVACNRIPFGKGVCGTAALNKRTERIANVHEFSGHIACDSASNAEIVIPVCHKDQLIAVLDIDSPLFNRFDEEDQEGLETLVRTFEKSTLKNE